MTEDAAAVLQAAQRGFVGTTWSELAAMEAALPPDLAPRLAGAFAELDRLREQHREAPTVVKPPLIPGGGRW